MKTAMFVIFIVLTNCFGLGVFGMSLRLNNFPSHCLMWDFWRSVWLDSKKCLSNAVLTTAVF